MTTILLVDDSPDVLFAATRTLRRDGHTVVTATTLAAAELVWQQGRPDLVLLDVNLPDGNGIEASHRWKQMPDRAMVPIVLRSAVSVSVAEQSSGLRSGADGYLVDPVEPEVLSATVAAQLRIRELIGRLDRSTHNAASLVRYSLELARAATPGEVVEAIAREAGRSLDAAEALIRWRRVGEAATHLHRSGDRPDGSVLARITGGPGSGAAAPGPRFHPDRASLPGAGPVPPGQASWAVLPFDGADVTGSFAFACTTAHPFDDEQRRYVQTFAAISSVSLARAAALELHRSIAGALQRALVPTPTLLDGVGLRRRLIVGDGATIAGGDWFDGYPVPSGDQVVVCGDVVGHGPDSAAASAVFRHTLRTLLLTGSPVPDAIAETDRLLMTHSPQPRGTLLVAQLSTRLRRARLYSAGHLPPVLIAPGEPARPVELVPVPPLGMGLDPGPPAPTTVELPPGAMLLLITDGVVEHRGQDIDDGYDLLCAAVTGAPDPDTVMRRVDEVLGDLPLPDDALFVVVDLDG